MSLAILVIHGPNLNMLGKRDPKHYGNKTLTEINQLLKKMAQARNCRLIIFQSNHEGVLIDTIQQHSNKVDGIVINAAALTHTSIALRDALQDSKLPVVEVHLSNLSQREAFRRKSFIKDVAIATVGSLKHRSYLKGLDLIINHLNKTR